MLKHLNQIKTESIKLVLSGLLERGIPIDQVVILSLSHLNSLAAIDKKYSDYYQIAALYIFAYLDLGFSYMKNKALFDQVLESAGYPSSYILSLHKMNPVILISKPQIRSLIDRWPASCHNSHTIPQAVEEIYQLCHQHTTGIYEYYTAKKDGTYTALYQLIVEPEYILFRNVYKNKYYTLAIPSD